MSGKTARRKRLQSKNSASLEYRVTQPPRHALAQAAYPDSTTRISSNARYIHAANHPEWYAIASEAEDGMLEALSLARLRRDYLELLGAPESTTPFHAYGFAVMQGIRNYCRAHIPDRPELLAVFDNAVATVYSNLSGVIIRDPQMLCGNEYLPAAFEAWAMNLDAFDLSDVFTYRPRETGVDIDGETKPIIEMCPVPRLGRHLIHVGYELLTGTIRDRQQESQEETSNGS